MDGPISPFEKWRLETIPQVGFTPEIRELLAMAFEGGRQSVLEKQEPVAWMNDKTPSGIFARHKEGANNFGCDIPLYTHPATWQSLSDDEIREIANPFIRHWWPMLQTMDMLIIKIGIAIEQALKEKNHG